MIQRIYYSISEAIDIAGGSENFNEMVEFHGLQIYVKISFHGARFIGDDEWEDTLCSSGAYDHARWTYFHGKAPVPGAGEAPGRYSLEGWFPLAQWQAIMAVNSGAGIISDPCVKGFSQDGRYIGCFSGIDRHIAFLRARIRRVELEKLLSVHVPPSLEGEARLSTRERASMIAIIKALAIMANADGRGATSAVERQLQECGFDSPKEATIRALLKEAGDLQP